jgi:hypothetical protein
MRRAIGVNGKCTALISRDGSKALCVTSHVPEGRDPHVLGGGCQGHCTYFGERERIIESALRGKTGVEVKKGAVPRRDRTSAPAWMASGVVVFEMEDPPQVVS